MSTPQYEHQVITRDVLAGWRRRDQRNSRAVIFVHGFWGDTSKTWKDTEADKSFPELVVNDRDLDDLDVFTFRYKTGLFNRLRIDRIAQQLSNEIRSSLKEYQLVLLTHSLGGLVCMQYILDQLKKGEKPPVIGLIMYGTPTTGLESIRIARSVLGMAAIKIPGIGLVSRFILGNVAALEAASMVLQDLHSEWILRVVNGGYPDIPDNLRAWIPVRVVTGNEDWVVKEHSAKGVYGQVDWCPIERHHRGLVKPFGYDDSSYRRAAEFFAQSRHSKPPELLSKLRQASDWVWNLISERFVRNWTFVLHFYGPEHGGSRLLHLPGFSVCEVEKCQYTLVLSDRPISLGMALGKMAADRAWREDNPAYIHGIRLGAVRKADREAISRQIKEKLQDPNLAWSSFFENVRMRICEPGTAQEFDLIPSEAKADTDSVITQFSIPQTARHLIGRVVVLDLGFRSIRPNTLCEFTLHFRWLTYSCNAEVHVHGTPDFVVWSPYFRGATKCDISDEDSGDTIKVKVSTDDIVLPDSSVRIQWLLRERRGS